jgi:NAD(P)H-dependent FMN reductase
MYKEMTSTSKRGKIVVSDGYLAVTPEYYRSISAAMKNTA